MQRHHLAFPVLLLLLAPAASAAPVSLTAWTTTPLSVGDTTFTYLESTGIDLPATQVEALATSPNYSLSLTSLTGDLSNVFGLKYLVEIAGSDLIDNVGLVVAANGATTSVTTDYFSDQYFNTIAAQPQTVTNTGQVTGGAVDGDQQRLWVWVRGTRSAPAASLESITNGFVERAAVPEPSTLLLSLAAIGIIAVGRRRTEVGFS